MATPADLQALIDALPWTNGAAELTGSEMEALWNECVAVFETDSGGGAGVPLIANVAALRALTILTPGPLIFLANYYWGNATTAAGPAGVGSGFLQLQSTAVADDGGINFTDAAGRTWRRVFPNGAVQPSAISTGWFGSQANAFLFATSTGIVSNVISCASVPPQIQPGWTALDTTHPGGLPANTTVTAVTSTTITLSNAVVSPGVSGDVFQFISFNEQLPIQAAIDYAIPHGVYKVTVPIGAYNTNDCIQLGYGWGTGSGLFSTVVLEAESSPQAASFATEVFLFPQKIDRPGINIQGGRSSYVRGIGLGGPNQLAGPGGSFFSGWTITQVATRSNYAPTGAYASNIFAPYCGICIDGYTGAAPTGTPYPSPVYPSWVTGLPVGAPYGMNSSSNCGATNNNIFNTNIGICNQPNGVANGDFMDFRDNTLQGLVSGIAICGSQSRNTQYDRCNFIGCYDCIDGINWGSGEGNLSGSMDSIAMDFCFEFICASGGWQKGLLVTNLYSESSARIGFMSGAHCSIKFDNCFFGASLYSGAGATLSLYLVPLWDGIGGGGSADCPTYFNNCSFESVWSYVGLNSTAKLTGCQVVLSAGTAVAAEIAAYGRMALVLNSNFARFPFGNKLENFNINGNFYSGYDTAGSSTSQYWPSVGASVGIPVDYFENGYSAASVTVLTFSSVTWGGRTFAATINVSFAVVGDVIFIPNIGWGYLSSVSGTSVVVTMLTSYQLLSGAYTMLLQNTSPNAGQWSTATDAQMNIAFSTGGANYFPINIFDYLPQANGGCWQVTGGSATITFGHIVNGTFTAAAIPTGITTATKLLWTILDSFFRNPFPAKTTISSLGTNTVVMSANAQGTAAAVRYFAATPGVAQVG